MSSSASPERSARYRPLPTGMHGLDPEVVQRDQRDRLRNALIELIAEKGYPAVRILDLTKLARVSQPTFYSLFTDKEDLFVSTLDEISEQTFKAVLGAYGRRDARGSRLLTGVRAFAHLAAAQPQAISLLVLGAFGAGPTSIEHSARSLDMLEARFKVNRVGDPTGGSGDLTIKLILGGLREVFAARLVRGEGDALPALADQLAAWCGTYQPHAPGELLLPARDPKSAAERPVSERALQASRRLPSGRSDMPREEVVKSQQERIVDATAAIVAEKGLSGLTIPEIARRANVSNKTFYEIYRSKHNAFLGAQKIGMLQALRIASDAYEERMPDWPRAIVGGISALVDYIASEPDLAHLSIVDTFGASPETIATREQILRGFGAYVDAGHDFVPNGHEAPPIAAEAVVGGCFQVLHHFVTAQRNAELPAAAPQLAYLALVPFLGPEKAAEAALRGP